MLLQSSLPCSENFYRYKKNYEKFVNQGPKSSESSPKPNVLMPDASLIKKSIASPILMNKLSPVNNMMKKN